MSSDTPEPAPAAPLFDAAALGIPTDADSIADGRVIAVDTCSNCHGIDKGPNVRADAPPIWLGHGTADTVVHDEDTVILDDRMRAVGGRSEAKLYPGLDHADLIATFSPLFRKKATVLADVTGFFHRQLG